MNESTRAWASLDAVITAALQLADQADESLRHTYDHAEAQAAIAVGAAFRTFATLLRESEDE